MRADRVPTAWLTLLALAATLWAVAVAAVHVWGFVDFVCWAVAR